MDQNSSGLAASVEDAKSELIKLIREKSYREGDFTLTSGQKSDYYIDLKETTLHPLGAILIGFLACDRIDREFQVVGGVGGPTLGADPISTAVSLASLEKQKNWPAYIVRKEPKKHGTARFIEGAGNLDRNAPLIVLEDVVSTGGSSLKACQLIKEEGYEVGAVLTVVDREMGAEEMLKQGGFRLMSLLTINEIKNSK